MKFDNIINENMSKIKSNDYPGRGIVLGKSPDGKNYVQVYFIMGRSENSRNRIFVNENGFIRTQAFDESKLTDPSLIIYYPVKVVGNCHIVTNGDQTDTIYVSIKNGGTFEDAIYQREYEPDAPNYTPRISGIIDLDNKKANCKLSIIKSLNNDPECCERYFFSYENNLNGVGHFIHTYVGDGNPLPSFAGEPVLVKLFDDIEETANTYWKLINEENKVSLMVKFINIETGAVDIKILNKHLGD